jgi:hypothetical protein
MNGIYSRPDARGRHFFIIVVAMNFERVRNVAEPFPLA